MSTNLVCLGCRQPFESTKSLSAHESRCSKSHTLSSNLFSKHYQAQIKLKTRQKEQRRQKRLKRTETPSSSSPSRSSSSSPEPHTSCSAAFADSVAHATDSGELQVEGDESDNIPQDWDMSDNEDRFDLELDEEPDVHMSPPPPGPLAICSAHSGRQIRLPARYTDFLPGQFTGLRQAPYEPSSSALPEPASPSDSQESYPNSSESTLLTQCRFTTRSNSMGLYHVYPVPPTFIPNTDTLLDAVDAPTLEQNLPQHATDSETTPGPTTLNKLYSVFSSPTAALLMLWHYSCSTMKSISELNRLAVSYCGDPLFNPADAASFSHERERKCIIRYLQESSNPFHAAHGWMRTTLDLPLPMEQVQYRSEDAIPTIQVEVIHRSIIEIIKSVFEDTIASTFHMTPFEQYWNASEDRAVKVYSEVYSSPRILEMHEEVNSLPRDVNDTYERVVIPLMVWSDATQLANFGDASLWPIYLSFGNQSKYIRGRPTSAACHHLAYIPKLPDNFQDEYIKIHGGKASTPEIYTLCKRELVHLVWKMLLDDDFKHAYEYGLLIECVDAIIRRFFPRFYIYACDYPEKIILACIKFLGKCLCPRCLAEKSEVHRMGTEEDMAARITRLRCSNERYHRKIATARRKIFQEGHRINGKTVKKYTESESLVPIHNAFSERLYGLGAQAFNFFLLFVIDLLHEFELGVWKAIFTHLLRILQAVGGVAVNEVNWRYRKVPTFGRGTIRKFHNNVSSMKRLAGRDFEDLLQCAVPAFEGVLPSPHNEVILDLLFDLASWHAYAKLRMHTDDTLTFFDVATVSLGHSTRRFQHVTCSYYYTTELPQEHAARGRRKAAVLSKAKGTKGKASMGGPKYKKLNLATYKYHALGDYPNTIREFGTTDNYSTQLGELEHRRSKRRFPRSGKKKNFMVASIANQEAIERFVRKVVAARETSVVNTASLSTPWRARSSPEDHYHIASSTRVAHNLTSWLSEKRNDPAARNFIPRLKDHLLARIRGLAYNGDEYDFTDQDRRCIVLHNNEFFEHSLLRVNYTTYDLRREQDTINPLTHADVMLLSQEDERIHPYWYARVVLIFHVLVEHRVDPFSRFSAPERMDVLFVRWFQRDSNFDAGWDSKRLYRLQFFETDVAGVEEAFGFIDPDSVMRGVHLIPAFAYGHTKDSEYLGPSFARRDSATREWNIDWRYFYVNMFVDRDMFMRFRGGGVGHKVTRDWNEQLQQEGRVAREYDLDAEMRAAREESEGPAGIENKVGKPSKDKDGNDLGYVDSEDDVSVFGNEDIEGSEQELESDGEHELDRIVADVGEELDDHIWAEEGFGQL